MSVMCLSSFLYCMQLAFLPFVRPHLHRLFNVGFDILSPLLMEE